MSGTGERSGVVTPLAPYPYFFVNATEMTVTGSLLTSESTFGMSWYFLASAKRCEKVQVWFIL